MSIKPILFNADMVRAILDGRKTVTRRVIKPQPEMALAYIMAGHNHGKWKYSVFEEEEYKKYKDKELYWTPSCNGDDILYVRETWGNWSYDDPESNAVYYQYRADYPNGARTYMYDEEHECDLPKWRPSIHMPKEAARIWLKVTNVLVERLQDITTDQIEAEGIETEHPYRPLNGEEKLYAFSQLWASTVKKEDIDRYGWEANPWVWVTEFERCEKPQEDN